MFPIFSTMVAAGFFAFFFASSLLSLLSALSGPDEADGARHVVRPLFAQSSRVAHSPLRSFREQQHSASSHSVLSLHSLGGGGGGTPTHVPFGRCWHSIVMSQWLRGRPVSQQHSPFCVQSPPAVQTTRFGGSTQSPYNLRRHTCGMAHCFAVSPSISQQQYAEAHSVELEQVGPLGVAGAVGAVGAADAQASSAMHTATATIMEYCVMMSPMVLHGWGASKWTKS